MRLKLQKYTGMAFAMLLSAALMVTLLLGVGRTHARYENTVTIEGVYTEVGLTSNWLAEGGQRVLLGKWTVSQTPRVEIVHFCTDGGTAKGQLICESNEYLTVSAQEPLELSGEGQTNLYFTATDAGMAITEATDVTVRVMWLPDGSSESEFWADLEITLLPVEQEDEVSGGEDVSAGEDTPAEGDTSEQTEAPAEEEETASGETSAETSGDSTETEDESTTEESVDGETDELVASVAVTGPEKFAAGEWIPLSIQVSGDAERVELLFNSAEFPAGTRYAVDGETPVVLGIKDTICITPGTHTLKFDFTNADELTTIVAIAAVSYMGETQTGTAVLSANSEREHLSVQYDGMCIIEGADELQLTVTGDCEGFSWKLEMLSQTENGLEYLPDEEGKSFGLTLTIPDFLLVAAEDDTAAEAKMILANSDSQAQAGSYRLTLQREQDGVVLQSIEIYFFVHY